MTGGFVYHLMFGLQQVKIVHFIRSIIVTVSYISFCIVFILFRPSSLLPGPIYARTGENSAGYLAIYDRALFPKMYMKIDDAQQNA